MGDKNLGEPEWKKFAKGRNLKDAAFLKALAALEDARTPQAKLAALDENDKQAELLRKAGKADKEVTSYLDDTGKAAARERKLQELEASKAEKEAAGKAGRDEEEEESPALLTSKMIPLLRELKKGDVTLQALVATAGKETVVLISRRAISPARGKLLKEQMSNPGGLKFIRGECIWEENAATFVVQAPAGGLAKRIKLALQMQTDLRLKVRVRGEDPDDIDDDGEAAGGAGEAQAPGAAAPESEAAGFNARLAALLPGVKAALLAAGPGADGLKLKVSEAGVFARKKEFKQAHGLLDEAEKLMGAADAGAVPEAPPMAEVEPRPAVAPAPAGLDPRLAEYNARIAALMPQFKPILKAGGPDGDALKLKIAEAGMLSRTQQFDQANAVLDGAERLLAAGGPALPGDAAAEGSDEWRTRLAAIEPLYQASLRKKPADADKMRMLFGLAGEQAGQGRFQDAMATLLRLEILMSMAVPARDMGYTGLVAYRTSLLNLGAAVARVRGQIAGLIRAIPALAPEQIALAEALGTHLEQSNDALRDLVDAAMSKARNRSEPIRQDLAAKLDEFIADVGGSELIRTVDANPFGVAVSIAATLGPALKDVRAALPIPA